MYVAVGEGNGVERARLWVLEENRRARRFYERHGFVPTGVSSALPRVQGIP